MTPKPECMLHIGHSKTGSTSIQNAFAAHRGALAALGVCYPTTPGWANHALVPASAAMPALRERGIHPAFWGGLPPGECIERFRTEFPAEMAALPPSIRTVILSSEQCTFILPDEAWARRVSGVYGNDLANGSPERAHAVLSPHPDGGFVVSVRAPLTSKKGADVLCRSFATGGGRAAAAGINNLPPSDVDRFIEAFSAQYA